MRKIGLAPVVDMRTEILILGTLPSDDSLAAGEYYANRSNDFWRLVEGALEQGLVSLPYKEKIEILKAHAIGLWDAFHTCIRPGSMDKDIREPALNNFDVLNEVAPKLRLVCFNGRGAEEAEHCLSAQGYELLHLPSSSSANRKNAALRLQQWKAALGGQKGTALANECDRARSSGPTKDS